MWSSYLFTVILYNWEQEQITADSEIQVGTANLNTKVKPWKIPIVYVLSKQGHIKQLEKKEKYIYISINPRKHFYWAP